MILGLVFGDIDLARFVLIIGFIGMVGYSIYNHSKEKQEDKKSESKITTPIEVKNGEIYQIQKGGK